MARPVKLTPEVQKALTQAIELGATYELACKYAGITYQTFRNWTLAAQEAKSGQLVDFAKAIEAAEGKAAVKWLAKIEQAGSDDWRAVAWKLERRYPQDYGKTVQEQQHTGKDGGPLTITIFGEDTKGPQ